MQVRSRAQTKSTSSSSGASHFVIHSFTSGFTFSMEIRSAKLSSVAVAISIDDAVGIDDAVVLDGRREGIARLGRLVDKDDDDVDWGAAAAAATPPKR